MGATRIVPELKNLTYSDRHKKIGLTSPEDKRKPGDLLEAYKIITGTENVNPCPAELGYTLHLQTV